MRELLSENVVCRRLLLTRLQIEISLASRIFFMKLLNQFELAFKHDIDGVCLCAFGEYYLALITVLFTHKMVQTERSIVGESTEGRLFSQKPDHMLLELHSNLQ